MKANELMLGDWVKLDFYDSPCGLPEEATWKNGRIVTLRDDDFANIDFDRREFDIVLEDVQPIPLTPEILEKNFQTYEGLAWEPSDMLDTIPAFTIRIDEDFAHIEIDLRYVHELQHVLKLFGIDKEVML